MASPNVEGVVRHIAELVQLENALSVLDAFLGWIINQYSPVISLMSGIYSSFLNKAMAGKKNKSLKHLLNF